MSNAIKLLVAGIVGGLAVLLLTPVIGDSSEKIGGVYENTRQYFSGGIDITGGGDIKIDGTTVVDAGGDFDGDVTPRSVTEPVETITADDTLTTAESGKVVYIGTAGVDLTLPSAATSAGITYRVLVNANFATTNMTITGGASDSSDDLIYGSLEVAGAVVLCAAEDTISFVNTAELPGDYVELRSNGTNWFLTGQAGATGGITCTDAD